MHKLFLFSICFLSMVISSCGLPLPFQSDNTERLGATRQFETTDPAFNNMIAAFEQEGRTQLGNPNFNIGDIPINFGNPENSDFEGVCIRYGNGTREIIIRRSFWESVDNRFRQSLLFHELGHCRLDREHQDSTFSFSGQTFKESLMNSIIVTPSRIEQFQQGYLRELFTQDRTSLIQAVQSSTP